MAVDEEFDAVVRPVHNPELSGFFVELTGITPDEVERRGTGFAAALNGFAKFCDGDYARATDSFDRAYEIERSPALGLWVARSMARAGLLMEAEVRYRDLAEQNLPPDAPQREWQAKHNADIERRMLAQRIASITVLLDGVSAEVARVSVNGQLVPAESVGVPRRVNPGLVRVHGEGLGRTVEANVVLAEGEARRIRLSFVPEPPTPETPATGGALGAGDGGAESFEAKREAAPGQTQRILSYVAVGLGGAALLTGGAFGLMALNQKAELDAECPNGSCPPQLAPQVDSYDSKRTVASVALLSGAALTATGVVLFFTAPRAETSMGFRAGVYWAGSSIGLRGQFR
jgi:hypothetical protein